MKQVLTFILIIGLLAACVGEGSAQNAKQNSEGKPQPQSNIKIKTLYDQAKNQTIVFIPLMRVKWTPLTTFGILHTDMIEMSVFFTYPGQEFIPPKFVGVGFSSSSERGAQFSKQCGLVVTVDRINLNLGKMELTDTRTINLGRDSSLDRNIKYVEEELALNVSPEDFLRIVNAKEVEVQLGDTKFKLSKEQLQALRRLANLMQPDGKR